jgi:GNAT superfamily N-acetyltransferase
MGFPMDLTKLDVEPLGRRHDRAAFTCDEPALTDYLRTRAKQDVVRDLASCWVLCARDDSEILGYYTLTATSIDVSSLPVDLSKQSGRYQVVGAALLGRLAVDSRYVGQGMGSILLLNALRRILRTTNRGISVKAVVVDALHERAAGFYEKFGFRRIEEVRQVEDVRDRAATVRLVLSLKTIRHIFPGEGIEQDQNS